MHSSMSVNEADARPRAGRIGQMESAAPLRIYVLNKSVEKPLRTLMVAPKTGKFKPLEDDEFAPFTKPLLGRADVRSWLLLAQAAAKEIDKNPNLIG
jgi:hypothetical protein